MGNEKPNYGNKTIYVNSILSLIYKFGSTFISFFTAPLLLFILGEEKYGAWTTLLSLISWIYYCDVGIGGAMRNRLAKAIADEDINSAQKYVSVSYATIAIIAIVVFVIVCVLISCFDICNFFDIQIQGENLNLCLLVAFLFTSINFVASLANNVLYAVQKSAMVSFFGIVAQLIFLITLIIFAITGIKTILWIAIGEGLCQLIKNVIETIYVYTKYSEYRFSFSKIDWSYSRGIMSLGIMMFIGQIAALILNTTDNLIISKYLGVAHVTPYSFCYKYFNIINSVYVALIAPLLSAYTMAYQKNDKLWMKITIKKNFILYIVFFVGTVLAMFVFEPFSKVWLQKELMYGTKLIFATMLYFLLLMFNHIWSTILMGIGRVNESTMTMVIGAIINIPMSIFLAINCELGTTGVILGSVFSLIPNTIVSPLIVMKEIRTMKI